MRSPAQRWMTTASTSMEASPEVSVNSTGHGVTGLDDAADRDGGVVRAPVLVVSGHDGVHALERPGAGADVCQARIEQGAHGTCVTLVVGLHEGQREAGWLHGRDYFSM